MKKSSSKEAAPTSGSNADPSTQPNVQSSAKLQLDGESENCLSQVAEQEPILSHRVSGVKIVLVVLSARGMAFDREALRHKILLSYPDAVVFFQNTMGKPIGAHPPDQVDLLIDFTGPGHRQGWFYSKKLRRLARVAIGRNAGLFRKKIYDRVVDERSGDPKIPSDPNELEKWAQKQVLNLAGVALIQAGETPPDRSKVIALELPGMQKL